MQYGRPFKLYLVVDPDSGKRSQISDKEKAESRATEIARRTKAPLSSILKPSRCWYVTRYLGNSQVKRVNTKQTTLRGAKAWVETKRSEKLPLNRKPKTTVLTVALEEWSAHMRLKRISAKTLRDDGYLAKYWLDFFGNVGVEHIDHGDIYGYLKKRELGKIGRPKRDSNGNIIPPSERLLMKDRTRMSVFFGWCLKQGYCGLNPVDDAPRWRPGENEPRSLDLDEIKRLLGACREEYTVTNAREDFRDYSFKQRITPPAHLYGIVLVALHTLLRYGNIARLRWEWVDLRKGEIRLPPQELKNKHGHTVRLTDEARKYLRERKREASSLLVFPTAGDNKRSFKSACRRAGIGGVTFHDLRKTGATLLFQAGVDVKTVQRMGGWKRADVLINHYNAVMGAQTDKALSVLNSLGENR